MAYLRNTLLCPLKENEKTMAYRVKGIFLQQSKTNWLQRILAYEDNNMEEKIEEEIDGLEMMLKYGSFDEKSEFAIKFALEILKDLLEE